MIKAHIYNKCIFLLFFVVALTSCNEVFDNSWSSSTEARSLALSNSSLSFTSEAQTKTMEVTSQNIPWSIVNNASWLSFNPNSGLSSVSVSAAVQENKSDTSRVAHTQLRSTDSAFSRTLELMVSQAAPEPIINFSESTIVFDGGSSEKRVSVDSNRSWTYSKSESWIFVSRDGNALLISVTANTDNGARDGFVTVTAAGKSEQIKITQRSANVTSTISSVTMGNEASSKNIEITSEANWTAVCSQSWIEVDVKSGTAGTSTIRINVTNNTSNDVRTGYIYIYVGANQKLEISVTQNGTILSVSPLELSFAPDASTQQIMVRANTQWKLSCSDPWIHVDNPSSSGNATVSVSVDRNISQQRVGHITLMNKDGQAVSNIIVTQKAVSLSVTPSELRFGINGGQKSLYLVGDVEWKARTGDSWIILSKESGKGSDEIEVTVKQNTSTSGRNGTITIYDAKNVKLYDVPITQTTSSIFVSPIALAFGPLASHSEFNIESSDEWMLSCPDWVSLNKTTGSGDASVVVNVQANESSFSREGKINVLNSVGVVMQTIAISQEPINVAVAPTTYNFPVSGGTKTISVTANVNCDISVSEPWLTCSLSKIEGNNTITLTAKENQTSSPRTAEVSLLLPSGKQVAKLSVYQDASSLSINPTSIDFGVDGGSDMLHITANTSWTLASNASWISLSQSSGSGNADVNVKVDANASSTQRTGIITLTNASGKTIGTISVSQGSGTFSVTPSYLSFGVDGDTRSISITANIPWTLTAPSWISLDKKSGDGSAKINVSANENNTLNALTGVIAVKNSAGETISEIYVQQDSYYLEVNASNTTISRESSEIDVNLFANSSWTATSSASWLSLNKTSGNGNSIITLNAKANDTDTERNAEVTFVCGNQRKTIIITQRCLVKLSATPSSLSFPVDGATYNVEITSNTSWTLSQSASSSWLTINKTSGKGNAEVEIRADANPKQTVRTANVMLKNADGETIQTIDVTQTALALSAVVTDAEFDYNGGSTKLNITSNVGWSITAPSWITLSSRSGSGNASLTFTVANNTDHNPRSGIIEVMDVAGSTSVPVQIDQQGLPNTEEHNVSLPEFASKGGSTKVSQTDTWTAEVINGAAWISLSATSGSSSQQLTITTSENNSGNQRTGSIKVTCGFDIYLYNIVQSGKTITLSASSIDFFAKGGESQAINATADKTVSVTSSASWLKVVQNGNTFTLKADKNTTSSQRTATITVTLTGVSNAPVETITVRQAGVNGTFTGVGFDSDENWNY